MALTTIASEDNLFDDFDEAELTQIYEITKTTTNYVNTEIKMDEDSMSGSDTVYIEPMDEEEEAESISSQLYTLENEANVRPEEVVTEKQPTPVQSRRTSISSEHDYGKSETLPESYRDDELEYTSCDENDEYIDTVEISLSMSQETVATQIYDPEIIETTEVQDVTNYGDPEIQVEIEEKGEEAEKTESLHNEKIEELSTSKEPEPTVAADVSEVIEDSQLTDTSIGIPDIFNSTVELSEEVEKDSQDTVIMSLDEKFLEEFQLPAGLTQTRSISEDHDYLAKKLPMNFNLVVEDPKDLVRKNVDHVISLATSLKEIDDKEELSKHLTSILNHISLLQDITNIHDDREEGHKEPITQPPDSPSNSTSITVKEEYDVQTENDLENLVVQNMTKDISSIPNLVSDAMEVDSSSDPPATEKETPTETSPDESLLIDPIIADVERLEKFSKDLAQETSQWRQTKETNLTKIQSVLKESDIEWRKLMLKFECPRDIVDAETQIDPKMFAKQNERAKKDILAFMNESESDELESDNENQQNLISIVEASYSDSVESEVEDELGKARIKISESQVLDEPKQSKDKEDSDSDEDSDASIDRLCNLKNLGRKIRETDKTYRSLPLKKPEKPGLNVEELINGTDDPENGVESEEELPPPPKVPATEAEFLKKINEEIKRQLLESSDSDFTDDESAISVDSEAHDTEETDESDSSIIMDRFLSSLTRKTETKPPSMDSGLDEKSSPKTTKRRRSSIEPSQTPDSKGDDDDALDLSMFKAATERVKVATELADLDVDLGPDTTEPAVPNVEDYISVSSDDDDDASTEAPVRSRHIRKIMSEAELAEETKEAQAAENHRIKRLDKMSQSMSQILTQRPELADKDALVLDYDKKNDEPIAVHPEIVKKLKPHQIEGVKFMYLNCYGPVDDSDKYPGSGCILAHCMGLGKTLQLIALLHTVIRYPRLKTNKILVLCPKSTIMNWFEEFERWISKIKSTRKMKVFCFEENMTITEKTKILNDWYNCGNIKKEKSLEKSNSWLNKTNAGQAGCLLLGYQAFRSLANWNPHRRNAKPMSQQEMKLIEDTIDRCLIEPGADMVVCDEGHMIKNRNSGISKAVSQIKTKRRIILTGTPIQNNLNEYYCMVNWIKPSFLGTEKEFNNRYANPIKQGQHLDSTPGEIRQMKKRSFVLHKKLQPFVERKEFTILKDELPKKHEYVLYVPLTEIQKHLYKLYLDRLKSELGECDKIKGNNLLPDYTYLRKIWTHPRVLEVAYQTACTMQSKKANKKLEKDLDKLIETVEEEDFPDDVFDISARKHGVPEKWWERHIKKDDLDTLFSSYKLQIMIEILHQCSAMGEKCLIFSNFVAVLGVVEYFLNRQFGYINGRDYYRLDGQTPKTRRHQMITRFNRDDNKEVKCFLISARAGGQGINLIGANRVIILDTSWNPAADLQSIFRVYRLGQKKTCFVYRLLATGTMEEKVYSRSVTKQAMSNRVVDEQQVDRHYCIDELAELYTFTDYDTETRPVPDVPIDRILRILLHSYPQFIYKYHEHDSLLESNDDDDLSDAEKQEAWNQYMAEEEQRQQGVNPNLIGNQMPQLPPFPGGMSPLMDSLLNPYNFSQLMYNMDPYFNLLSQLPPQKQPPPQLGYGTANPLLAMGNMNPGSLSNFSGGGIANPSASRLDMAYRSPSSMSSNPLYNLTSEELLAGIRQRSSSSSMSPMSAQSSARSHPVNGIARNPPTNKPSEPVPVRLTPNVPMLQMPRTAAGPSKPSNEINKRKQQLNQPTSSRVAFEEQYLKHFGNQMQSTVNASKQKAAQKSNIIEIPDDDQTPSSSSSRPSAVQSTSAKTSNPGKVVKNANIGIHYPPDTQNKGTPIYLPDLPEGTSINKIPKQTNPEPSTTSQASKQNSATITKVVPNKFPYKQPVQTIQRSPSISSNRPTIQGIKSGVQNIGNMTIIPTPKTTKPTSVVRMQQQQPSTTPKRVVPSTSAPAVVKKVVQQITQNSRGNTSITPVTRVTSTGIPTATSSSQALQGWKRKESPNTNNSAYPAKMIRLNPNLQKNKMN